MSPGYSMVNQIIFMPGLYCTASFTHPCQFIKSPYFDQFSAKGSDYSIDGSPSNIKIVFVWFSKYSMIASSGSFFNYHLHQLIGSIVRILVFLFLCIISNQELSNHGWCALACIYRVLDSGTLAYVLLRIQHLCLCIVLKI